MALHKRLWSSLILENSALIATITSVTSIITVTITITVATACLIPLAQQGHTAEYVDTMSGNVSLVLTTQEVVDGKQEVGVDALKGWWCMLGLNCLGFKSGVGIVLSCWQPEDLCGIPEGKWDGLWLGSNWKSHLGVIEWFQHWFRFGKTSWSDKDHGALTIRFYCHKNNKWFLPYTF